MLVDVLTGKFLSNTWLSFVVLWQIPTKLHSVENLCKLPWLLSHLVFDSYGLEETQFNTCVTSAVKYILLLEQQNNLTTNQGKHCFNLPELVIITSYTSNQCWSQATQFRTIASFLSHHNELEKVSRTINASFLPSPLKWYDKCGLQSTRLLISWLCNTL